MNKNPFPPTSSIKDWTVAKLTTVCTLTIAEDITHADVMEFLIPTLCDIGLIKSDDKCEVAKIGDLVVISKYVRYMDLEVEDKRN